MRTILLIAVATFFFGSSYPPLEIEMDYLSKYRIPHSIMGNDDGTHYLNPIVLNLENQEGRPVSIRIPVGYMFHSIDSFIQDMIVTEEQIIVLQAGEKRKHSVPAMCTQSYNSAPSTSSMFRAGGMARSSWVELSKYISDKGYNGSEGQMAMWALTSGLPLENIGGWEAGKVNEITAFTARLLNVDPPHPVTEDNYRRNYNSHQYKLRVNGTVNPKTLKWPRYWLGCSTSKTF